MRIIDSGTFLPELLKKKKIIMEEARKARLNEGKKDAEAAFDSWYAVSDLINQFEQRFLNTEKIGWAYRQSFFRFSANFLLGVLTGIISSIIVSLFWCR